MSKVWRATALTGGAAGALDALDGSWLADGDLAIVEASGTIYFYVLDHDNSSAESSPAIISPDKNYGTKRWVLQGLNGPDIHTVGWTDYTSSVTWTGFNPATPDQWAYVAYKKIGKLVFLLFNFYGTSNAITMKFSLPFTSIGIYGFYGLFRVNDNSVTQSYPGFGEITVDHPTTISFAKLPDYTAFTASGLKGSVGQIWYEATT